MTIEWSPQQSAVLRDLQPWAKDRSGSQIKIVHGFAGTGKTTLATKIVESSGRQWLYGALTGKAALVMHHKGCIGAKTVHSLIYRPNGERTSNGERIKELEGQLAAARDAEQKALSACSFTEIGRA